MTPGPLPPLDTGQRVVPHEWIDYNGHMMDGYYPLAFSAATDAMLDRLGLGEAYRTGTGFGMYTVESHVCYARSVHSGTLLRFRTLVLGGDVKRLRAFHEMTDGADGAVVATNEVMLLHVNGDGEKVVPMPADRAAAVAALAAAHAALPVPPNAGRHIGQR